LRVSGFTDECPANPVVRILKWLADDSPSPWGEGRDEGGRETIPISQPHIFPVDIPLASLFENTSAYRPARKVASSPNSDWRHF